MTRRAALPALLHTIVPTRDRIAPIGDHARDSSAALFDYHRSYALKLQYLLGPDDPVGRATQSLLATSSVPEMGQAFMFSDDLLYFDPGHPSAPVESLHTTYYAPGTGQLLFRSSWAPEATWGALMAGPYSESHAHRDQGSLLVYRGEWLAYDQNVLSHSGIVQDERVHNLVRFEEAGSPIPMAYDTRAELVALRETADLLYLAVDVTPAYGGAAAVAGSEREVLFLKALGAFVVLDRADTSGEAVAIWTLNTPGVVSATAAGHRLTGSAQSLDVLRIHPADAESTIIDWTTDPDMTGGFRLEQTDPAAATSARFLFVLAPGDAVSATAPNVSASEVGLGADFASGAHVEISFGRDTMGAWLRYLGADGALLFEGPLGAGLDELPLLAP